MPRPFPLDAALRHPTCGGMSATIEVSVLDAIGELPAAEWDACACPEAADGSRPVDPFTTHRFLDALETSRSVGPGTGWTPRHLVARSDGRAIAVMPLYAKAHSQGEYIFDHGWADAWERAGGRYYPKLQSAVPFTPATGRRLLTAPGWEVAGAAALVEAATPRPRLNPGRRNGWRGLTLRCLAVSARDSGPGPGLPPGSDSITRPGAFGWDHVGVALIAAGWARTGERGACGTRRWRFPCLFSFRSKPPSASA